MRYHFHDNREIIVLFSAMKSSNIYIIDAFNLIHAEPQLRAALHQDVQRAIENCIMKLEAFCITRKVKVQLVFDGQVPSRKAFSPKLTVIYSNANTNADEVIIGLVRRNKNARSITVVSSDNHVIATIKNFGAKSLSSSDFLHILEKSKAKTIRKKKENPNLSQAEVDEWLKEFSKRRKQ